MKSFSERVQYLSQELQAFAKHPLFWLSLIMVLASSDRVASFSSADQVAETVVVTGMQEGWIQMAPDTPITIASSLQTEAITTTAYLNILQPHVPAAMNLPINYGGGVSYAPPLTRTEVISTPTGLQTITVPIIPELTIIDSGAPNVSDTNNRGPFHEVTNLLDYGPNDLGNIIIKHELTGCAEGDLLDVFNEDNDPSDDNGHGSAVTGLAAAMGDEDLRMVHIKGLNEKNASTWSRIAKAIITAAECRPSVINMSLGVGGSLDPAVEIALAYAQGKGKIIIAAAGNTGVAQSFWPASAPGVIAVGASEWTSDKGYSWWPGTTQLLNGKEMLIATSGSVILSFSAEGEIAEFCCTSGAAPQVAAIAATMLSRVPDGTPFTLQDLINALVQYQIVLPNTPANVVSRPVAIDYLTPFVTEAGDKITFFIPPNLNHYYLPLVTK